MLHRGEQLERSARIVNGPVRVLRLELVRVDGVAELMRKRTAVLVNRKRVQHLRALEHIRHAELRQEIIQKAQIELRVVCNDQRPLAEHPGKHLRRLPLGNSIVQQHPLGNARVLDDFLGQMPPLGEPDKLVHCLQLAESRFILPSF